MCLRTVPSLSDDLKPISRAQEGGKCPSLALELTVNPVFLCNGGDLPGPGSGFAAVAQGFNNRRGQGGRHWVLRIRVKLGRFFSRVCLGFFFVQEPDSLQGLTNWGLYCESLQQL